MVTWSLVFYLNERIEYTAYNIVRKSYRILVFSAVDFFGWYSLSNCHKNNELYINS